MQIGSIGPTSPSPSLARVSAPEAVERGPDKDNDGDKAKKTAEAPAPSTSPSSRGSTVDISA